MILSFCSYGEITVYTSVYMLMLSFAFLQSISISALDVGIGVGTESVEVVRPEHPAAVPIVTIRVRLQNNMFLLF